MTSLFNSNINLTSCYTVRENVNLTNVQPKLNVSDHVISFSK